MRHLKNAINIVPGGYIEDISHNWTIWDIMRHQKNAINIVPGGGVHQGCISQPDYKAAADCSECIRAQDSCLKLQGTATLAYHDVIIRIELPIYYKCV